MNDPVIDIKAYLDGELDDAQAEAIKIALETDPALAHEASQLSEISQAIQSAKIDREPVGLEETLEALEPLIVGRRAPWVIWAAAIPVAAVLAFIFFGPRNHRPSVFEGSSAMLKATTTGIAPLSSRPVNVDQSGSLKSIMGATPSTRGAESPKSDSHLPAPNGPLSASPNGALGLSATAPPRASGIADKNLVPLPLSGMSAKSLAEQNEALKLENERLKQQLKASNTHIDKFGAIVSDTAITPLPPVTPDVVSSVPLARLGPATTPKDSLESAIRNVVSKQAGTVVEASNSPEHALVVEAASSRSQALLRAIRGILQGKGHVEIAPKAHLISADAQEKIDDLKRQKDKLLETYLPEAPSVVAIDEQIKELTDPPKNGLRASVDRVRIKVNLP